MTTRHANLIEAMAKSSKPARDHDPTTYPEEEKVGEDILQRWIAELLRPLLERWFGERGVTAFVGADQFIYYRQYNPFKRISPDVYVLPGVAPRTQVTTWKIWETGIVPSFCLEVVSKNWLKDYVEIPERCQEFGVPELVIFDPRFEKRRDMGALWQVYRRTKGGNLRRIEATDEDRVRSRSLGCWLRAVGTGEDVRIRIGTGPRGEHIVPTGEEAERAAKEAARKAMEATRMAMESERAAMVSERAAKEAERAAKEAERAAKETALARVSELEAEMAMLRGGTGRGRARTR